MDGTTNFVSHCGQAIIIRYYNNIHSTKYERVHDATVFAYLYNGMRPQYRKYCDTQTCTNVAELLKACKDFENGEEGQALLGPNKITTSTMSAMTSNPGNQQSTGSNKISCGYCGINNHGFEIWKEL